jgi:hypothetical protein
MAPPFINFACEIISPMTPILFKSTKLGFKLSEVLDLFYMFFKSRFITLTSYLGRRAKDRNRNKFNSI